MHAGGPTAHGMWTCFGTMAGVKRLVISVQRQRLKSSSKLNFKLGTKSLSLPARMERTDLSPKRLGGGRFLTGLKAANVRSFVCLIREQLSDAGRNH